MKRLPLCRHVLARDPISEDANKEFTVKAIDILRASHPIEAHMFKLYFIDGMTQREAGRHLERRDGKQGVGVSHGRAFNIFNYAMRVLRHRFFHGDYKHLKDLTKECSDNET